MRTSEGRVFHGEDAGRTTGAWRDGDLFVVRTTGAVYVRTDGVWMLTPASFAHDALTGLDADDHTQYLLATDATDRATFAADGDLRDQWGHYHAHGHDPTADGSGRRDAYDCDYGATSKMTSVLDAQIGAGEIYYDELIQNQAVANA